jgi:apolipoprotein N-acyltransferase
MIALDRKLLFLVSYLIVAFGAPSLSLELSIAASAFGYALFWKAAQGEFWIGVLWFAGVQAVQLNWLASMHYMGPLILVVYALVTVVLGLQFGCLTSFVKAPFTWSQIFALSGFWVFMEWIRLFFLSGFTWNPIGLSLAAQSYSIQFASVFGVYGLCFWLIFTNLAALKDKRIWLCLALFPYLFGFCNQLFWGKYAEGGTALSVALVQTALRPEQRDLVQKKRQDHIHPLVQWERILSYFQKEGIAHYDLIVFPEGALPGGPRHAIYPIHRVNKIWSTFGTPSDFPPSEALYLQGPHATNSFWLQSIANHFGSEVIVGLDERESGAIYNAAFHFNPASNTLSRCEKQVLIPIGEYIPFSFLGPFFSEQFGLSGSFNAGNQTKVFQGKIPLGVSICLEETYGELVRSARKKGAKLLVNITNDVWFPKTRLPWHHFDHGRLRAAENGAYVLRSCNTGVTSVIDCFGRSLATLPVSETVGGILSAEIFARSYPTLYTTWGDTPILLISLFALLFSLVRFLLIQQIVKKKLLEYGIVG